MRIYFSLLTYTTIKSRLLQRFFLIGFLFVHAASVAQKSPFYGTDSVSKRAQRRDFRDSVNTIKRFNRAVIEFGISEFVPFSLDRFIKHKDYANITWKSTGYNLTPGHWAWDNDNFVENQFGHPYHGSYFFNAFRTNGYSFWQSVPAAFAGSYLWETFAENQAPAPNDFINTSFGGVVLGEMTYRLSNKIVNSRRRGLRRQLSEIFGLLISPTNGLNRILDGKWGKVSRNTQEVDSSHISAEIYAGYRRVNANGANLFNNGSNAGWYIQAKLLYGTPYENFDKPFSNVIINAEIGKDDSTALNTVSVYGSLTGWQLDNNSETIKHLLVVSANYDYIHNAAFFYGGQSVKFNLYSVFQPFKMLKINTILGAGTILLGAVPDAYLYNGRNYDYGSGLAYNAGGLFTLADKFLLTLNYRGGWTHTWNGNSTHNFLHLFSGELGYQVFKQVAFNAETGYFNLSSVYANTPVINQRYPYLKVSAKYAFNIR